MRRIVALVTLFSSLAMADNNCKHSECLKNPKATGYPCTAGVPTTHKPRGKHGTGHLFMAMLKKIDLTAEQKKQIDAIHEEYAVRHHHPTNPTPLQQREKDHGEMTERIRKVLTPAQNARMAQLLPKSTK